MNQTFVKSVTEQLPQLGLLQDEPMKKHTTFRIGGPADYYAEPDMSRISKLIEMAKACDMPVTVIGNGSNLLVGDKGIRGLVIGIGKGLSEIEVTEAVAQQGTAQDLTAQDNGHIITAGAVLSLQQWRQRQRRHRFQVLSLHRASREVLAER